MWGYACCWDGRGEFNILMALIHSSVTMLTSRRAVVKKNITVGVIAGGEAISWNNAKNEWTPYSWWVVTDVFSTELGIRLSFVKSLELRGVQHPNPSSVRHWLGSRLVWEWASPSSRCTVPARSWKRRERSFAVRQLSVFTLDVDACFVEIALTTSASAIKSSRRCIFG
jgi:hypothetical protein